MKRFVFSMPDGMTFSLDAKSIPMAKRAFKRQHPQYGDVRWKVTACNFLKEFNLWTVWLKGL